MNTALIEVSAAYPPTQGKKQARIKTAANDWYYVWPDKLGLLRPGFTYEIEFSEREYEGRKFRTITRCQPKESASGSNNPVASRALVEGATGHPELEFVTRILAASIQACAVDYNLEGLTKATKMLRAVYREVMG